MTGQVQVRNDQMVELLGADLQRRYEPNFAWKSACAQYQALCALRGFWPMSAQIHATQADYVVDVACNFHLTNYSACQHNYDDLAPYVEFDGVADYLYYVDDPQFDVIGNEPNVGPGIRGLTLGGWFYFDEDPPPNAESLITKGDSGAPGTAYWFERTAGTQLRGEVSNGGVFTTVTGNIIGQYVWTFCALRYDPGAPETAVFQNGVWTRNAAAPATMPNVGAPLNIGSYNNTGLRLLDGRASLCFLCASALSDVTVFSLYHQTRAMFGI